MSFQLEPLLNDVKGKNLKLKANCTSLLKELDHRAQELRQRGRVVSASDPQSGGPGFESRSGHLLDFCSFIPSSISRPCL